MTHDPAVADYRATSPADGGGSLRRAQPSRSEPKLQPIGFEWITIHDTPNLSATMPKRVAKKVSAIGI